MFANVRDFLNFLLPRLVAMGWINYSPKRITENIKTESTERKSNLIVILLEAHEKKCNLVSCKSRTREKSAVKFILYSKCNELI